MKKVISVAAAMTLLSTGAFAFDADANSNIVFETGSATATFKPAGNNYSSSGYRHTGTNMEGSAATVTPLASSNSGFGDALIYPYFKFGTDAKWETEITVRNTKAHAIVAKVVLYAGDNSRELRDFNIYLTPKDVFTFKINNEGKILTSDDSIPLTSDNMFIPNNGTITDEATFNTMGTQFDILANAQVSAARTLGANENSGYVAIYGMVEETTNNPLNKSFHTTRVSKEYHKDKVKLFKEYRKLLDQARAGWRNAFNPSGFDHDGNANTANISGFSKGVFVYPVAHPNINLANVTYPAENNTTVAATTKWRDVENDALYGEVKITSSESQERDLVLPATALTGFTSTNQALLWSEGEYAAIQDRRIGAGTTNANGITPAQYKSNNIKADSRSAFNKSTVYFAFSDFKAMQNENSLVNNKLIITQPYKRILTQLDPGNANRIWSGVSNTSYGQFGLGTIAYDHEENPLLGTIGSGQFVSPYDLQVQTTPSTGYSNEVAVFDNSLILNYYSDLSDDSKTNLGKSNAGILELSFSGVDRQNVNIPGIVTQMKASQVGDKALINWFYAPAR